jgi:hypothetical protein
VPYELRGSIGIFWKGERQFVIDKEEVGVLESYGEDLEEGVVVVGDGGQLWMHGILVGGLLVAGESACVELQVKNPSSRKVNFYSSVLAITLMEDLPQTAPRGALSVKLARIFEGSSSRSSILPL